MLYSVLLSLINQSQSGKNVFSSDYSIFLFAEREKLVLLTRNCRAHLLNYLNQVAGIAFA
jgi:hypothetical protein